MNIMGNNVHLSQLKSLYDDVELAILFEWLGIRRPPSLYGINIESCSDDSDEASGPIRLIRDMYGHYGNFAESNAVARLVLSRVQGRLPQWAAVHEDGRVDLARSHTPKRLAKVNIVPRFQFMINWADSGPGYSWPESYFAGYLPGFDLFVVTASQDTPEVHGYADQAIGHFPANEKIADGVHRAVTGWWNRLAGEWDQHCWAYIFEEGDVDTATAMSWAAEVWDTDTGEQLSESA
jgi:hypothetical protein